MVEMEKMTWIIMSNFSQQTYSLFHAGMTNLFLSYSVLPQYIPNLIYVKTPSLKDTPITPSLPPPPSLPLYPFSLYTICRSSIYIRTFWTECLPELGISNNHWNQMAKITKDPYIRQFTPFQNMVNIVSTNIPLLYTDEDFKYNTSPWKQSL